MSKTLGFLVLFSPPQKARLVSNPAFQGDLGQDTYHLTMSHSRRLEDACRSFSDVEVNSGEINVNILQHIELNLLSGSHILFKTESNSVME